MKLLVFGRDPQQADIVLSSSQYVSSYHAELIQLDNGDMYIVDKSSNGTYLNGNRLTPGKEVAVRRGDDIKFADVPLDWSVVEDIHLPANVKSVKSIGSHYMNDIKLQGAGVSRFHATLRQTKDNKWYICDHSKNGTSVNGERLPKNRYVQVKPGDEIVCAGAPVPNPNPHKPIGKYIGYAAGAIAACVAIFLIIHIFPNPNKWENPKKIKTPAELYSHYSPSVVFMYCGYHFEVECGSLDLSTVRDPLTGGRLITQFVYNDKTETISVYDGENSTPYTGTGFFIGPEGYIATNLHIARPWLAESISTSTGPRTVVSAAEDSFRESLSAMALRGAIELLPYLHLVKVVGVLDWCVIVPNGEFYDGKNAIRCTEVIASDNLDVDLAIFRIRQKDMPSGSTYVPFSMISEGKPSVGSEIFIYGYPYGASLQDLKNKPVQVNATHGEITKEDDDDAFLTTAAIASGSSGSPAFNQYGQLVGVMNASRGSNFNYGIYSYHLLDLIEKAKIDKEAKNEK